MIVARNQLSIYLRMRVHVCVWFLCSVKIFRKETEQAVSLALSATLASQYMETSHPPSHINELKAAEVQFVAFRP